MAITAAGARVMLDPKALVYRVVDEINDEINVEGDPVEFLVDRNTASYASHISTCPAIVNARVPWKVRVEQEFGS